VSNRANANEHTSRLDKPCNLILTAMADADATILKLGRAVEYDQGTIICEAEERLVHVLFPLTCVLSSLSTLSDGTAIETASAGHEGAFGLLTAVGSGHISARCQVQMAGWAVCVPADQYMKLFHASEPLRRVAMLYIETVMAQNVQSVACRTSHSLTARLCRWLLTMDDRLPGKSLEFTHEFVAPALGANRTTLSLATASLRRDGAIAYTRGSATILDRKRLENTTCECYFSTRRRYERLFGA
jgi:CRP-like cAMP-binding protein